MPSYDGDLFAKGVDAIRAVRHAANSTTRIPYWSDSGYWCLIVSNDPSNNHHPLLFVDAAAGLPPQWAQKHLELFASKVM